MTKRKFPAMVVAGTGSGVGKTSISLAITRALKNRGLAVQAFKTGPDYIDPIYLSRASGKSCYNLDTWISGDEYVHNLFAVKSAESDVTIIEGVMGLFDGDGATSIKGSAASVSILTGAPVVLVIDAKGMGGSAAALVKGFCEFNPKVRIAAVIANNCGSDRHRKILDEALRAASLPPLVGAIPRGAFPAIKSRHLGLASSGEAVADDETINAMAAAIEKNCGIEMLISLAASDRPAASGASNNTYAENETFRLGVAHDEAFHFYYQDTFDQLEARGVEIVRFSPLRDDKLPDELDGLYIGGGYPEEHAETLAENNAMLESVRRFALYENRPVYAECGGLMYLSQGVKTVGGKAHRMAGLLPAWTAMREKYKSLGYAEARLEEDSLIGRKGSMIRGHRFHYSETEEVSGGMGAWRAAYSTTGKNGGEACVDGFAHGNILASYVHAHLASNSEAMDIFVSNLKAAHELRIKTVLK